MSYYFSKIFSNLFGETDIRIPIFGLDAAGKTTMMYKLHIGEVVPSIPAIGMGVKTIKYRNITFEVVDVGGCYTPRECYPIFFQGIKHGFIYVVDSTDRERISEAAYWLKQALCRTELRDAPILVFANKQDLNRVMSLDEITSKLDLNRIHSHKWHLQASSARCGDGLLEGLQWLAANITTD